MGRWFSLDCWQARCSSGVLNCRMRSYEVHVCVRTRYLSCVNIWAIEEYQLARSSGCPSRAPRILSVAIVFANWRRAIVGLFVRCQDLWSSIRLWMKRELASSSRVTVQVSNLFGPWCFHPPAYSGTKMRASDPCGISWATLVGLLIAVVYSAALNWLLLLSFLLVTTFNRTNYTQN